MLWIPFPLFLRYVVRENPLPASPFRQEGLGEVQHQIQTWVLQSRIVDTITLIIDITKYCAQFQRLGLGQVER